MKKSMKLVLAYILLAISLIGNLVFAYFYYYKQAPNLDRTLSQLKDVSSQLEKFKNQASSLNCQKVYSISAGAFKEVCPNKAAALAKCSNDFGSTLAEAYKKNPNLFSGSSFSDLDKGRDLIIKICMQNQGFNY